MTEREIIIRNKYGLHARPSAAFVQAASQFKSDIYLVNEDRLANGKSIISLMVLAAECGARVTLRIDGDDEAEAMEALVKLINNKFNIKEEDL
ncbi:MAG: HPr family phosphocarrier protein [Fibrobacterota bacterium]